MKEHGLIRTGEMVRAFLDGRKTQTRIRIKRLPIHADYGEPQWDRAWLDSSYDPPCLKVPYVGGPMGETTWGHVCKYAVGDLVYVRETWWAVEVDMMGVQCCVFDDEWALVAGNGRIPEPRDIRVLERQDWRWGRHSSLHLPREHSRLWYPITAIKAPERARDISEADAIAEGVWFRHSEGCRWYKDYGDERCETSSAKASFLTLWQALYGRTDEWTWPLVLGERIER